jgi:hypothetical protein
MGFSEDIWSSLLKSQYKEVFMSRRQMKGYKKRKSRKNYVQQTKYKPAKKKTYGYLLSKVLAWLLLSVTQQIVPGIIGDLLKELGKVLPNLFSR